ncbi:MAG: outer membrane protein assembly factor BamD [Candidatus Thiodiazotropha sp. (ex Myrtea sp. 'scaly one' KF741663)]|nr:outer membrane protein assembly factor BamD [Candidatus Thiodiazotropha sp. (ex Myrtea sp. 'scaly one' KF741663)]
MTFKHLLALLISLLMLAACAVPDLQDETKGWSASQFYSEAKEAMLDGEYDQAIKYYEGLQARFPFGPYATQSQLDLIYTHYKNNEPDSAIAAADRFIKLNPQNPFVDYAYYLKGLANYNRNTSLLTRLISSDPSQRDAGAALTSFNDFAELARRYPESKYSTDARQRMLYLRSNLAKYQIHVARYYMKRGAYLAAANRANRVVSNFQRTDAVKDALEIMVDAYTRLGMTTLAEDAGRVLALNIENGNLDVPAPTEDDSGFLSTILSPLNLDDK